MRPTTLAHGRAGACCACSRFGTGGLFFRFVFTSSILSSFSNASSVGRRLDILKYCGLGRYNRAVVVSHFTSRTISSRIGQIFKISHITSRTTSSRVGMFL